MLIGLALFTIGFFAWWIILGLAEADVIKNKKLTKWRTIMDKWTKTKVIYFLFVLLFFALVIRHEGLI